MSNYSPMICRAVIVAFVLTCAADLRADSSETENAATATADQKKMPLPVSAGTAGTEVSKAPKTSTAKPKKTTFSELLKDAKPIEGLVKLYRKDTKLYAELSGANLNQDLIVIISIARGIGQRPLLGGMSWGFGNDWVWQFRKVGNRIQIVRRNVRFRAAKGTPQEKAVEVAYTDSVLFSLPIAATGPGGSSVVDLTPVFMSDLPRISSSLRGFSFSKDKSSWAVVKGFEDNVEIQVAATYSSSGATSFDTVADSRGATINVHYSISRLPQTGYQPRPADDRVGYFVTVLKDYSKTDGIDRFVRYVNRWDLRKADPSAAVSPPKKPIIFWLEKTIPFKYRKPIREGILEWNKAFEKAGFVNAIEVRQQPDDARWDPEDINYNTFRWITASAAFAMGPSRVNPITGQILDADIIFDADFVRVWPERYEVVSPGPQKSPAGSGLDHHRWPACDCARGMRRQLAFGSMVLAAGDKPAPKELIEKLIMQGVKSIAVHEVGHTLGLRHNFKASTLLTLEEINDVEKTRNIGLAASVMDYLPMNIVPKGQPQGEFFGTTVGPYDYWAIEYGYKPLAGNEEAALGKIASRCAEPALQYGTDEDARPIDPDPHTVRYDLGKDPIRFAQRQVRLINQAWPGVVERMTAEGDGYHRARQAFNTLLAQYGQAAHFVSRFIGGLHVHRDHKGDPGARPPFVVVDPKKQREAMTFLEEHVFGPRSYQFPAELYNHLAPLFWVHWGTRQLPRSDYPIHEVILSWQNHVLSQLFSPVTLSRLVDSELKVPAGQDAFTAAELIERLTTAVFSETEKLPDGKFTNRQPAINSLRRGLQRSYLERLAKLAMGNTRAPEDCRSVAYAELEGLEARIKRVLAGKAQLDTYTRAHLNETAIRIRKILDARLQLSSP